MDMQTQIYEQNSTELQTEWHFVGKVNCV